MFDGRYVLIISPRRKRIAFRVNDSGLLEVAVPCAIPDGEIRKLIAANLKGIERLFCAHARRTPPVRRTYTEGELFPLLGRQLELTFSARLALITEDRIMLPAAPPEKVRAQLECLYRRAALELLSSKCRHFGAPAALIPRSVGITNARTRWGSCSSRGHISFCWKLLLLPEELADYIVCHELAHLRHLDHSSAFWALTEQLCPDASAKRKRLHALPELWPPPAENAQEE